MKELKMDERFEELKKALFDWGNDYIEEFLGYYEDVAGMKRDEIEDLMNEAYEQMPDVERYIRKVLQEIFD